MFGVGMHAYLELVNRRYDRGLASLGLRANFNDLYPYWLGTRYLLREHLDPYSDAATRLIQIGYYGRPLDPTRPGDPKDEHRFIYPVHVCLLLAPVSLLPFAVVRLVFVLLILLAGIFSAPLWNRALSLHLQRSTLMLAAVLVVGSLQFGRWYTLLQISPLMIAVVAAASVALAAGRHWTAGMLVAIATVKPHLALPFAGWFVVWSLGDWPRRRGAVLGFLASLGILLAGSEMILPGWLPRWWSTLQAFSRYQKPPLAQVMFGETIGALLAGLVVLGVAAACWTLRRHPAGSKQFAAVLSLVAVGTAVILPNADAIYDHLIMLPAALWLGTLAADWAKWRLAKRIVFTITVGLLAWQWITAAAVSLLALISPRWSDDPLLLSLPIRSEPALPFVAFLLVILCMRDEVFGRPPGNVYRGQETV
ncbi:MAG TPA: glycosyltransferase family 87 protein [Terriglobales bacterium]|nr:glycosyltransferase family 87 protein [Terriglobales bacterium]